MLAVTLRLPAPSFFEVPADLGALVWGTMSKSMVQSLLQRQLDSLDMHWLCGHHTGNEGTSGWPSRSLIVEPAVQHRPVEILPSQYLPP